MLNLPLPINNDKNYDITYCSGDLCMTSSANKEKTLAPTVFSGNIVIYHAFDIGEDINLEKIQKTQVVVPRPLSLSKYFKNYHTPLEIELPHPHESARCVSSKIHNFGAISLTYQIPFNSTLEEIRTELNTIDNYYKEQSVIDAKSIFKRIKEYVGAPSFFQIRSSYLVVQVTPNKKEPLNATAMQEQYGSVIASLLRFETESLSEYQKNEILDSAIGYYRGDLVVIDTEATFIYDDEYEELLNFFEFGNIQQLELRYFDRLLDKHLNLIYEEKIGSLPLQAYLPFMDTYASGPVGDLGKLKVEISVITERLENSIKLVGDAYFSELYSLLVEKLDLKNWRDSIEKKLAIIKDIRDVYEHKTDTVRESMLEVLIVILISIELVIGLMHYWKK